MTKTSRDVRGRLITTKRLYRKRGNLLVLAKPIKVASTLCVGFIGELEDLQAKRRTGRKVLAFRASDS